MSEASEECPVAEADEHYVPNFLNRLDSVSNNGLYLNSIYLPQEIITLILSYLDGKDLLQTSLVCRKWLNIVRSNTLWYMKFKTRFKKKPKKVPWYVYYAYFYHGLFDRNLVRNGNGEEKFKHWMIVRVGPGHIAVEDVPEGSDPLPTGVEDFNGHSSCFVTGYAECLKLQRINLAPLCKHILDVHKPRIYVSEWIAGRFDTGCSYTLSCSLYGEGEKDVPPVEVESKSVEIKRGEGKKWLKVEMVLRYYPTGVDKIVFQHEGCDTDHKSGHHGTKMAGGVLKILFNSMKDFVDKDEIE